MKRLSMKVALVVLTLTLLVLLVTPLIAQESDKDMVLTDILLQSLQHWHFSPQKINGQLPQRVFKLYLKNLDPNKQFLLKSDVAQLKNYQLRFDGQHKNGILDFYDLSIFMLRQRIEESNSLTQEILKQPFDFSINENYETNPEKKDYPSDVQELKKQWRLRLKYQTLLAYLDIINATKEKLTSNQVTDQSPMISDQPFQPEIECQARTKVAQNLKRSFERLLHKNDEDRFGDYLNAIAGSFDPHTEYFLPEQKDEFDTSITGVMEGIGATLKEDGDYTTVVEIIPGSAAWKQKELQTDDTILKIAQGDGEPVDIATMSIYDVVKLIRGKKGTEVRLTVKKPNGRIVVIPIIRDVVVMEEAYAKSAIISNEKSGKKYGYIDLPSFYRDYKTNSRSCADDIRAELQELNSEKVSGIILDLRNNGGGSLDDAVKMAGLFIKEGPIVQVKDNNGQNQVLTDPDPNIVYDGPLVVLVNSLSASASEILAAALQDYSRAIIVGGPKTFCKGTVQTVVDFDQLIPDSMSSIKPAGSLKLTIAKFYRINGGSTQGKGVVADIPLPDIYSYLGTGEKTLDYSLPWDTISAVSYQKWTSHLNISHLKQLSKERIQTSKVFKLISDDINLIQHEQKNSETLKFTSFIAEQKLLQKESEQLKNLSVGQLPYIRIVAHQSDSKDEQSSKMTDWLGQINKDAYIDEARHILDDMSVQ
jgi:carboxyl-terminal processing protease